MAMDVLRLAHEVDWGLVHRREVIRISWRRGHPCPVFKMIVPRFGGGSPWGGPLNHAPLCCDGPGLGDGWNGGGLSSRHGGEGRRGLVAWEVGVVGSWGRGRSGLLRREGGHEDFRHVRHGDYRGRDLLLLGQPSSIDWAEAEGGTRDPYWSK